MIRASVMHGIVPNVRSNCQAIFRAVVYARCLRAVALSCDGATVIWGGDNQAIWRWTRLGGEERTPLIAHRYAVTAMTMSGDGDTIVWGDGRYDLGGWQEDHDGAVRYWTRQGGQGREPLIRDLDRVSSVAVSSDGDTVVSGHNNGAVRRWTRQGGEELAPLLRHDGVPAAMRAAILEGKDTEQPMAHPDYVSAVAVPVAVSRDGGTVVSGGEDCVVRCWTRQGGNADSPLITHKGWVNAVAVSGAGDTVVSGGWDGAVRRWTRQGGEEREPLMTHGVGVTSVALSGDGKTVVSGGYDCTIRCYREGHGVVCVFLFNSRVWCLALADAVGRTAAGLLNGEVPILDLRNFPLDSPG
jgi:WD40 repeat protein